MIKTIEYRNIPVTILHTVNGNTSINEVQNGIIEAENILNKIKYKHSYFNLIIDLRNYEFTDVTGYKKWKVWLITNIIIKKNINYIAIISSSINKKFLNTEKAKFFFDFEDGINWLEAMVNPKLIQNFKINKK